MSRKRSLAGFDAVANTTSKTNTTTNDSKNNNNNTSDIDSIINKKKPAKKLTGLYLEKEIADVLDRVVAGGTKGAKSEIANAALRRFFEEQGLL